MWEKMYSLMNDAIATIGQIQQTNLEASSKNFALMMNTYARLWGLPAVPVVENDKRFTGDAWQENLISDTIRQSYLITTEWMKRSSESIKGLDPVIEHRIKFWTSQMADMMSPANFAITNPVVIQEAVRTGGASLLKGLQNFLGDLQKGRLTQVPDSAFVVGKDLATTPGKVIYRNPLIELIQYEPTTTDVYTTPILMIPPWINKYYVMDMQPENSLYQFLVNAGFTVFTISWKNPDKEILNDEWFDYMNLGVMKAIDVIKEISNAKKINVAGYCLGGIIQQTVLAYLAAKEDESILSATYFATHQDFTDVGDIAAFISKPEVEALEWLMDASGGYLDGRNLAATFNMLRSNDLLWNYVVQNYLMGKIPPAFDLLYWNNDGTRVPGKVHSFLLRNFFLENKLPIPGGIEVNGVPLDTRKITVPTYTVAATGDHIVPWHGAFYIRMLQSGPVRLVLTSGGHIAGVINPPAKRHREYWINENEEDSQDLDLWLKNAVENPGSWWNDWVAWLRHRSGKKISPPKMGNEKFQPMVDAPGTYVLEK